ncbi:MAG TPA: iron ABC transporter permease [Bacteroidota bacterium]|nr:iron ABC transporter permease [Bacteroidota bacterium]
MPPSHLTFRRTVFLLSVLAAVLVIVSLAALLIGSSSVSLTNVFSVLTGRSDDETARTIILQLRIPRIILAILVGAGLSVAGATLQSLLRNPLAEPYILGISSGGTVGAFLAITLGLGWAQLTTPLFSFVGSGLVMMLVYSLGYRRGLLDPNALLLSGVMVGAFFNSIILVVVAIFNQELRTAYLWMMGNLSGAESSTLVIVGPLILVSSIVLILQSRALNLIAVGDESAAQFGVNVERIRRLSYILASLITGLAVSVSGVIGFVGLLVPHVCRLMFGSDNRIVMPASLIGGGIFLVLCDLLSRTLLAPSEIPVGAITAAVGAPLFVYLLKRG